MKKNIRIIIPVILAAALCAAAVIWFVSSKKDKITPDDFSGSTATTKPASADIPEGEQEDYGYTKLFNADIDGDGEEEEIMFSHGPTSGIYTFALEATKKNSNVFYYNMFAPRGVSDKFVIYNDKPAYMMEDEEGNKTYYYISVENGNIVLKNDEDSVPILGGFSDPVGQKAFMSGQFGTDYLDDESRWGVALWAENVSATGLTLRYTQAELYGDETPTPDKEILTGEPYTLEVYRDGKWEALPTKTDAVFNTIGYIVPRGKEAELNVNWEWLYGKLENSYKTGFYRIGKSFTMMDNSVNRQEKTVYAYFAVYD